MEYKFGQVVCFGFSLNVFWLCGVFFNILCKINRAIHVHCSVHQLLFDLYFQCCFQWLDIPLKFVFTFLCCLK